MAESWLYGKAHPFSNDRVGNLVDTRLSEKRDLLSAKAFFKQAIATIGLKPDRVTTDKHVSYRRAVRQMVGRKACHRTSQNLNNRIEQDHRGIKQRCFPIRSFGSLASAARFCTVFSELRQYFRFNHLPRSDLLYRNNVKPSIDDGLPFGWHSDDLDRKWANIVLISVPDFTRSQF